MCLPCSYPWGLPPAQAPSIRDVIAFPKSNSGRCLMTDAPGELDAAQHAEYHIRVTTQTQAIEATQATKTTQAKQTKQATQSTTGTTGTKGSAASSAKPASTAL